MHRVLSLAGRAAYAARGAQAAQLADHLRPNNLVSGGFLRWLSVAARNGGEIVSEPEAEVAGPRALYMQRVKEGTYRADSRQTSAVTLLQHVYDELVSCDAMKTDKNSGLTVVETAEDASKWSIWNLISRNEDEGPAMKEVKGLYMFGGVGCGKTMMMDIFYECLPPTVRKKRIHFHDFMLDVHDHLRKLQKTSDPLQQLAQDFTRSERLVLCLDEFMVTDVADAMVLKRLFTALFDCGLVLVSTSNRAPDALYEGGLQRNLFLPFIGLLKERCAVHEIRLGQDYRLLAKKLAEPLYFEGAGAHEELEACFEVFSEGEPTGPRTVQVQMGRELHVTRAAGPVAAFTFAELCDRPVAAADYIALCDEFHTILLDGVPVFNAANRSAAYRFVTLVDVVYEERVRLICAAEAGPLDLFRRIVTQGEYAKSEKSEDMCVDDTVGFAKDRTVSRLIEMQSQEYAIAHAQEHAPELLPSLTAGHSPPSQPKPLI